MKCVTDCIESDGPPCGGIVPIWLDETLLYTDAATCCSTHLSDVPIEECVFEGGETLDPLASPSPSPDPLEASQQAFGFNMGKYAIERSNSLIMALERGTSA